MNIIQFRSISVSFYTMYYVLFQSLDVQKIFVIVRFFNRISCNNGLKFFHMFFFVNPWGWNVLESERPLCSWHHVGWRNKRICIHGAEQMEQKHGKCWKLPIFEKRLWLFVSYLSEMKSVSMFYNFLIVAPFTVWRYLNSCMTSFFCQTFCFHFQIQMNWTAVY